MATCPACGRDNPEGFQFCGFCSSPLVPSEGHEVRKTVTVLFSDVTGSTSLGELLDPESLRNVMSRYFDLARTVVLRHGGTVEKFIGDAVMAVFGVPTAHEDDALRAVRAATEMRENLAALNDELERGSGVRLEIRTGVNSGEVVAGDPSSGQSFVSGDTVNVAARLEQAAQPGEILIGAGTLSLVHDAVQVEATEPLQLKGKAEPVPAFRLLDVLAGAPALARRLDSPLVGREGELRQVLDAFDRVEGGRSCELVTIVGEAGVGKSRLTMEVLSQLAGRANVLEGRCLPYGEGITFWALGEMVRRAAGIDEADPPAHALAKIAGLLNGNDDAALVRDRVGAAIGLSDATGAIQETFWATRRLLEALAADRPVVAVFDDIHWAEPTLLDLLEYVAGFSREHPVLVLCMARPELRETRPEWDRAGTVITLSPLDPVTSEDLIQNLIGSARLPSRIRDRIVEAAEGNPLFVEEMLRKLIDDGVLRRDDGAWVATADLSRLSAPGTIQALITARLDRLQDEERAVIQRAAVVGQVFYWGAVAELSPEDARPAVGMNLQTLQRKELIRPEASPFAGQDAFRFSHLLVRDAAYESMPKRNRADMHERFASWLERVAGDRVAEYEEIVGYHLEQAHRYVIELGPAGDRSRTVGEKASSLLAKSGRAALDRSDVPAALNLLSRALALVSPDAPARPRLLVDLCLALELSGRYEDEAVRLEEAATLARAAGDRRVESLVAIRKMALSIHLATSPFETLLGELRSMLPDLEEAGEHRALGEVWENIGLLLYWLGRSTEAERALERAVHHARAAGDRRGEVFRLGFLTNVIAQGPIPAEEAIARLPLLLERSGGSKVTEGRMLWNLSLLQAMSGRIEEARRSWRRSLELYRELGILFRFHMYIGWVELIAGDPAEAEGPLREGIAVLEAAGGKGWLATTAAVLAEVLWRQGKNEEAERHALLSDQLAAPDDWTSQWQWRAAQAKVLADRDQLSEAEALARAAVSVIDQTDYIMWRGDARMSLAYVLRKAGRPGEATTMVREALQLYERKGDVADASKARAELEDVSTS
ncbi:MAG: AAA family ATPase [Actinomycetota bacterium]|nr:AAA family ATPase [Actinomycetota bacterium]